MVVHRSKWSTEIKKIVSIIGSKKHNVILSTYCPGDYYMSGWDGGSKSYYEVIFSDYRMATLTTTLDTNRFNDPFHQRKVLPPWPENAIAIVKLGIFRGKEAIPVIMLKGLIK